MFGGNAKSGRVSNSTMHIELALACFKRVALPFTLLMRFRPVVLTILTDL